MKIRDSHIDATSALVRKIVVVGPIAALGAGLAGVKVASIPVPFGFEVVRVDVTTVTDGGGNAIDVKVGAQSVLAAAIVPAAGKVAGVLHATVKNRRGASGTQLDVIATTATAGTWMTVTIGLRSQTVHS